jgi:hypothetical protein
VWVDNMVKKLFFIIMMMFLTGCFSQRDYDHLDQAANFWSNSIRSDQSLINKFCDKNNDKNNVICFKNLPSDERLCKFVLEDFNPPSDTGDEMFWVSNFKKYIKFTKKDVIKKLNELKFSPEECIKRTCYPSINHSVKKRWEVRRFVYDCQNQKKAQKEYLNEKKQLSLKKGKIAKNKKLEENLQKNRVKKCESFGFKVGSQEMANCTFEIYKLEMQNNQKNNFVNEMGNKKNEQTIIMEKQLKEQQLQNDMLLLQKNLDYLKSLNNSSGFVK